MSILRIRTGWMVDGGGEAVVISWWRRERRMGFVPVVGMPHLKAKCFSWVSLRVLGRWSAIHVVGFGGVKVWL